jgi:hypothetical protein
MCPLLLGVKKMEDQYKNKKQLIEELEVLRKELVKLKKIETKQKKAKEKLRTLRSSDQVIAP